MKRLLLLAVLFPAAAGCGRRLEANYKHCLKLRVGMTREDMRKVMGPPDETIPFVEGKSLEHLRGRTAYEWSNPASMPGPDHVSVEDATGKIASIRCSNVDISASVFIEPPAPSTAAASAPVVATASGTAAPPAGGLDDALAAYRAKDLPKALKIVNPLAGAGNADAQLLLAMIFLTADQVGLRANPAEAARLFYQSGRQKNCEAAALYVTTLDPRKAGNVFLAENEYAASLGCPAAKRLRADLLLDGFEDLAAADPAQGMTLLREAAADGSPAAQADLGARLQREGKDPVEAYRWTLLASRHPLVAAFDDPLHSLTNGWKDADRDKAAEALRALKKTLSPAQVAEAEKRAGPAK